MRKVQWALAVLLTLAAIQVFTFSPAAAQVTGQARGSGSVQVFAEEIICFPDFCFSTFLPSGEAGHFSFDVHVTVTAPPMIRFVASNPVTGDHIRMETGDAFLSTSLRSVLVMGSCEVDGQLGSCHVFAQDNGEPGSSDVFDLFYSSPSGGSGQLFGLLLSGNVEVQGD